MAPWQSRAQVSEIPHSLSTSAAEPLRHAAPFPFPPGWAQHLPAGAERRRWDGGGTARRRTPCQGGETHERCLKTESCYFNYGLSALSPIAFLTHSSANLVINQSRVARSCSLAPSPSLPCSLRALAPLVCSPAPPVSAFLIGFGLEAGIKRLPPARIARSQLWLRGWQTCLPLVGQAERPTGSWGCRDGAGSWVPTPGCRHGLLCTLLLRLLLDLCPKLVAAGLGGCGHAGWAEGQPPPRYKILSMHLIHPLLKPDGKLEAKKEPGKGIFYLFAVSLHLGQLQ